jgi:hypothetical protein
MMRSQTHQQDSQRSSGTGSASGHSSPALEWIWKYLSDLPSPRIMDCGPVSQATVDVLVKRRAKIHVADLVTPLLRDEAQFWDRRGKIASFRTDVFLSQLLPIAPESLTAIFAWNLLDLLPHEAHAQVAAKWFSFLRPGGLLFCIVREPRLERGSDTTWWLENLTTLGPAREGSRPFAHPVVTNREVEKLAPGASVKTFLTRSGRREVVFLQDENSSGLT